MRKLLCIFFFAISACSLGDHPQIVTYTINAVNTAPAQCKAKANLQIIEPTAAPGLDSPRIAVMQGSARINYYSGVKWAAPVSEMVQAVLIDSFDRAAGFASVNTEAQNIHNDLLLLTDIRNFEVADQTSGKIHLRLVAKLVSVKDGKILAVIPVEEEITPDTYRMDAIIAAFNNSTAAAAEIVAKSSAALSHCKEDK